MDEEVEDEVFTFRDVKPTPDTYYSYDNSLKNGKVPIILDHGTK